MSKFAVQPLVKTPTVTIRDVYCQGSQRHQSGEECTADDAAGVPVSRRLCAVISGATRPSPRRTRYCFSTPTEGYRVSHPVPGGDASLTVILNESLLREIAPPALAVRWRGARISTSAPANRSARSGAGGAAPAQSARENCRIFGS